jgi:diaminopimelate decarboxylase
MGLQHHPFKVNEKGHLEIGEMDTVGLAQEFQTPLFVYDVQKIRRNCRAFTESFNRANVAAQVNYASKAFSSVAMFQVIMEEGLGLDVVSGGELYTAIKAGFPPERIHFHGNNKSEAELQMALDYDIGCIIIDNMYEITLLENLLRKQNKQMDVLIRITPGIESETHAYIMTGNEDSKFGFNLENGQAEAAYKRLYRHPSIRLKGIHSHIGSQIFNTTSFVLAIGLVCKQVKIWHERDHFTPEVLNFGGGFGIRYTKEDLPIQAGEYVAAIVDAVKEEIDPIQMPMPEIWIEPGRSIVGDAGVTLYTIGSMKDIPGVRDYIAVDGGMSDNIRPALYQAKYDAVVANKVNAPINGKVSVAGKCCESGDMLVWDVPVPKLDHGDLLAMFSTGAYGYAMASNYNRLPRPAVVFVENNKATLVVKRESLADIVKNDLPYSSPINANTGR